MVWAVETLNLTKDIATSHLARKTALKRMRGNTHITLEKGNADLREMNARVQAILDKSMADLAQAETERREQAKTDSGQRQSDLKTLKAQVPPILETAKADRKTMNAQVQAILDKSRADLAQAGTERAEQARTDLRQRQADLKAMKAQAQAILEKAKADMKAMKAELQADLAQAGTERVEQARTDLKQRLTVTRNRIATIGEMLGKCRTERENASLAWQKLAGMMFTRNERPPTKTVVSPLEGKTAGGARLKSTILDKTQLPDSVFKYLTKYPAGIRMTELEKAFDVPRIHMAKIIKSLLDSNKIEKREKLYFANQAA